MQDKKGFVQAGLVTNDEKSIWQPSQSIEWLGIIWNSVHGNIHITGRSSSSIEASIVSFVNQTFVVSARELPSFTGKIHSAGAVFGNISRIMTRHCAISVVAAADGDTKFALDNYCVGEIQFWKSNLYRLNTKNIDLPPITSNYAIYSDVVPLVAAPT